MNTNPLNRLPANPEWVRKVDAFTEAAAKELGCMVVLVAVQENGKLSINTAGAPEAGALAELSRDIPRMFATLATACSLSDALDAKQERH
jgi:hypothetical protein